MAVQTYFGVRQECLTCLVVLDIRKKSGGGREDNRVECDAYGENLAKATLPGSGWTCHHDAINNVIDKIIRQFGMESQLKIEDYFINKVRGMAVSPENTVPIMNTHLKGYTSDGRQLGFACGTFPVGID